MSPTAPSERSLRPADHRLTILVARNTDGISAELAAWSRAGLLRPVLTCRRDELVQAPAGARCEGNVGGGWTEMALSDALRQAPVQSLIVAALRPKTPADLAQSKQGLENEDLVLQDFQRRFRNVANVEFRSLTVSMHDSTTSVAYESFSPKWDMHLIHDVDAVAHSRLPAENVSDSVDIDGRLVLCAATALTASGAWRFCHGHLIEEDPGNAVVKSVRVVRPQIRVVLAGQLLQEASTGLLPLAPPWPMPSGSGTVRAQAGAVPPPRTAAAMCRSLGLEYAAFAPQPEPRVSLVERSKSGWHSLTHDLDPPDDSSPDEHALDAMRDQLAQGAWRGTGKREVDAAALRQELERSGLSDLVGGAPHDPVRWGILREFAFCLVDGDEPSDEVARHFEFPVDSAGRRLLWTDPNSIVAAHPRESRADNIESRQSSSGDDEPKHIVDSEGEIRWENQHSSADDDAHKDSPADTATEDNLLRRMRLRLDVELQSTAARCAENLRTPGEENKAFDRAKLRAANLVRARNTVAGLIALAAVVVAERWIGVVGSITNAIGIGTLGGTTSNPAVEILIGVAAALLAVAALAHFAWRAGTASLEHFDAQRLRRWRAAAGRHDALEAARLCAASVEFDDHAEVIATMLHRPYSTGLSGANGRMAVDAIPHPFSMMLAQASPVPRKVATLRLRERTETVSKGWISGIFADAMERWRQDYEAAVAGSFDHPDDDHTPPGLARHRDSRSNEEMLGPREHFSQALGDDDGLRRAITSDAISEMLVSDLAADAATRGPARRLAELLGAVTVPSAGALDGLSVTDFLDLRDESDRLNWEMLRHGRKAPGQQILGHQVPVEIPEGPGHPETLVASWRVLLSDPFSASDLSAWAPSGDSEDPAESVPPSVV